MVTRLSVEAAYDRWSRTYDGYDNPMVFMAGEVVRRSIAPRVRGQRVFEFGCGTGRNLAALAGAGARSVAGCDVSSGMLDAALQRGPFAGRLYRHDMSAPGARVQEVADASIDLALFCLSLEHVPDLAVPLAEARRMLAPAVGRIAIIEIHPFFSLNGGAAHFEDGGERIEMPAYPHRFADYLNAFAEAGLCVEHCREWRPRDLDAAEPLSAKVLKRGPDFPLAVEFRARTLPDHR